MRMGSGSFIHGSGKIDDRLWLGAYTFFGLRVNRRRYKPRPIKLTVNSPIVPGIGATEDTEGNEDVIK